MKPPEFNIIRSYLERLEDFPILADVISIAASSLDPAVLAAAADTIHYHVRVFRAMGSCDDLFGKIAARYTALRTIRSPEREMLLSFSSLARTVQADGQLLQLLSHDLSRLDQKNSIAACSPASDNMGEVLQTGSWSDDEIERELSSGTSMDQQMMARVHRKIINNFQLHVNNGQECSEIYSGWFHRLRSFDEPTFESVVIEWMSSMLKFQQVDILRVSMPILVGSGCVVLTTFLDTLRAFITTVKTNPLEASFQSTLDGLRIILPCRDLVTFCPPQDAYRFRMEQRRLSDHTTRCVAEVVGLGSLISSASGQIQLSELLSSELIVSLFKHYAVSNPGGLSKLSRDAMGLYSKSLFYNLLDPLKRLSE